MQDSLYKIDDVSEIFSPALVVFRDLVEENITEMIRVAGDPQRLRPHCKTYKIAEIVKMQMQAGITKFKCATIAEAEMLANSGATDIFLAYNLVGPNIGRALKLMTAFPNLQLAVTADHAKPLDELSRAVEQAGLQIQVVMDLDTGLHRTGVPMDEDAINLYEMISSSPGIRPGGLHWYDGQHHQTDLFERQSAVEAGWQKCVAFRDRLLANGFSVPRIVAGGTGSFPIYAAQGEPGLELSPGTVILHDAGYGTTFPDLHFTPAALLLTRVISRPTPNTLTLDLGHKAVAADPPQERREVFPELPDAKIVLQNEEHLVVQSQIADEFEPGDYLLAIPWHICPTTALHQEVYVVADGKLIDRWQVASRNRRLTI